jgi:gliding motility-associated lipoprotein GldD
MFYRFLFLLGLLIILISCEENHSVPKPRSYPKVEYPEKTYVTYNPKNCPFVFDIPAYSKAEQDTTFFDEKPPNDCWTNVYFPAFNGQLYCSYYEVKSPADLEKLIADGHKITSKHNVRADFIDELVIQKKGKVYGVLFDVQGPAASSIQFYLTDSTNHFFNASLYFNTEVRPDSIKPVFEFIREDVLRLIESFEWKS